MATEDAAAALRLAFSDPRQAQPVAERALLVARGEKNALARSYAEQALGICARVRGDIPGALKWLRAAEKTALRDGLADRAAEVRLSLSLALASAGKTKAALDALDRSEAILHGERLAQLRVQRAIILRRTGKHDQALDEIRGALPVLRRAGDKLWEARALCHRGLANVDRGAFIAAEADLCRAEELFGSLGDRRDAAANRQNRGWCAARAGDVPKALEHYDRAEQELSALGLSMGEILLDRAEVLLSVGVAGEAMHLANQAVERYGDDVAGAAEAMLRWAEAALLNGDAAEAQARAAEAADHFAQQRRPGWLALARLTEVRALWALGETSPLLLKEASSLADELDRLGLPAAASESRLIAGRTAFELGKTTVARDLLHQAARVRGRGPAGQRARGWLAEALLRLVDHQSAAAQSALRAGLRVLDEHRMSLGATDLRAHASAAASDLAAVGLELALDSGKPGAVLSWTERWRAGALRLKPVLPPDDAELASDLAELRKVASEVESAATAGRPTRGLLRRQAELEESVRRRTRRAVGDGQGRAGTPSVAEIRSRLGDSAFLEIVEFDGRLHGIVVAPDRCSMRTLGKARDVEFEMETARFGLRRLVHQHGSPGSLEAAAAAVRHAGQQLDELLLAPVRREIGDRPLIVVPPATLHALPWGILPSCEGRPVTVAPSAGLWLVAAGVTAAENDEVPVFIAGPDLEAAQEELAALSRLYPRAARLTGDGATVAAVCGELGRATLAHIAAHGSFRTDNPLFSSLKLADGPLTAYDLQRVGRAPRRVILAACDSGLAGVRPGDELMGLAAVLFPLGTASLVASVVPVPDGATADLMVALHGNLATGASLALALTAARSQLKGDERALATAAAFGCFGAG